MSKDLQPVAPSLRNAMRSVTPARVALERTGESIATRDQLSFQLAHAQARDAVHAELDIRSLVEALGKRGLPCLVLRSAVDKGSNAAEGITSAAPTLAASSLPIRVLCWNNSTERESGLCSFSPTVSRPSPWNGTLCRCSMNCCRCSGIRMS